MKAKHIAFLSLSVLAGTFASCTGSHVWGIERSVFYWSVKMGGRL